MHPGYAFPSGKRRFVRECEEDIRTVLLQPIEILQHGGIH